MGESEVNKSNVEGLDAKESNGYVAVMDQSNLGNREVASRLWASQILTSRMYEIEGCKSTIDESNADKSNGRYRSCNSIVDKTNLEIRRFKSNVHQSKYLKKSDMKRKDGKLILTSLKSGSQITQVEV